MEIKIKKALRASKIAGTLVKNPELDKIGEIEDVVIDLQTGEIVYAVLHFQSWFQDKLFAIPWTEFSLTRDEHTRYFVLDTTRETLKWAPGFNPIDWPDVASEEWRSKVDAHYQKAT